MTILSQIWSLVGLLTVVQNALPSQVRCLLQGWWDCFKDVYSPNSYIEIPEFNGYCGVDVNELYRSVQLYLSSLDVAAQSRRVSVTRATNSRQLSFTPAPNQTMADAFEGSRMRWTHRVETFHDTLEEKRSFRLQMKKCDRARALAAYLDHVARRAEEFDGRSRDRKLYTNSGHASRGWTAVPFRHPATFATLALDPPLMDAIRSDLDAFAGGKDFYSRVGRAWKRGYLLHGLPGTGKSSLIAAIANHFHYDVYDLELTKVTDNSELRALLIQTTNRSIIVIEDIDCSLDLTDRLSRPLPPEKAVPGDGDDTRVTLSGLLNFTDGLWSCCGEERIIVFTTNHKDRIDSALIRSGRMDMHILLSTCGFPAFKRLAFNYLGIEHHDLFPVVEQSIQAGGALTPAEISEILIKNKGDHWSALKSVISALHLSIAKQETDSDDENPSKLCGFGDSMQGHAVKFLSSVSGSEEEVADVKRVKKVSWHKKVRHLIWMRRLTQQPMDTLFRNRKSKFFNDV